MTISVFLDNYTVVGKFSLQNKETTVLLSRKKTLDASLKSANPYNSFQN